MKDSITDYRRENGKFENAIENTLTAMKAAKADAKQNGFRTGAGGASSIGCPSCESGKLSYSVASVNGHMHARCSTPDCVAWME